MVLVPLQARMLSVLLVGLGTIMNMLVTSGVFIRAVRYQIAQQTNPIVLYLASASNERQRDTGMTQDDAGRG